MIPEEGYYQPEVFPWNGGFELTEDLAFMKRKVVPFLLNHPYSGPFRYPVNAKAEGIYPDYFKVGIPDISMHKAMPLIRPKHVTISRTNCLNKYCCNSSYIWANAFNCFNNLSNCLHLNELRFKIWCLLTTSPNDEFQTCLPESPCIL